MNSKQENPLFNLSFNILIPVLVLNKGHQLLPEWAERELLTLLLALTFPVLYGLYELIKHKRKSLLSVFGILNVLLTGGLAVLKTDGIWFAVKEAAFPLLIGLFVLASVFTKKPFFQYLMQNIKLLNWQKIHQALPPSEQDQTLKALFKKSTVMFSLSFFLSAVLNFALAFYIFYGVKASEEGVLNQKIADMTWLGFVVIGLPMTIIAVFIFWSFIKKLKHLTGLSTEQILITQHKST